MRKLGEARVEVPEISGLAYHPRRDSLFAVGDDAGKAFELSRSEPGRILAEIDLEKGNRYDLEGIAVAPDGETLLVVAEKKRRVLRYDLT
ncbi:MAG: SdiA-regulated domain-containing protein, partial [Myxococcota bacterium]